MERRPCQNRNDESCPVFQIKGYCFEDVHHLYYPKAYYQNNRFAKEFRELPDHKVEICRAEHNEIHATERPPLRPSLDFMKNAIAKAREMRANARRKAN